MTSENAVDNVPTMEVSENDTKAEVQQESTVLTIAPPAEELVPAKIEGEEEKPKRGARKKRETPVASDAKDDNSEALDTQPLFEQPVILEGKRSRKPTSRLELSDLTPPKKELSIPQGHGKPLGEIAYINYQITHASTDALSHLRNVCFGRRASKTNVRQSLREFNGFEFDKDSDDYQRHLNNLTKLKKDQLRSLSDILGLPASGRNEEHAERILAFLMNPADEGKAIPERTMSMRTPKNSRVDSKASIHTDDEDNENGGDQGDDDEDELFNEEDEEEGGDTDDDYIGSDDEGGVITKDDPDDFVYQPGKKTPKKRTSLKRSRSGSPQKRKRVSSRSTQRSRKKPKVTTAHSKTEKEDLTASAEPMQTTDQAADVPKEDNSTAELRTNDPTPITSEQNDTTTNNPTSDIIPTTS